ncbi:hypothetical protein [Stenotrophomonas sp. SrG]|uniref:hypothetical protein n=1 Tax=Stenotrophomonas sp. SrG TaxID=3414430 RepID=UPI003CF3EB10
MTSGSGALVIVWIALGLLWLLVPFAIFAIKRLLQQILAEQKRTNAILAGKDHAGTPAHPAIPEFQAKKGIFG